MGLEPLFTKIMEERASLSNLLDIAKDYLTPADAKDIDPNYAKALKKASALHKKQSKVIEKHIKEMKRGGSKKRYR